MRDRGAIKARKPAPMAVLVTMLVSMLVSVLVSVLVSMLVSVLIFGADFWR